MKKLIESLTGGYSSSAKVVDGTLILSLPDALSPVVWRMDLGHVKSSALEVRDNSDGTFSLVLKTPREDVHNIAPFAARAQAVRALMSVSHALEHAQGRTTKAAPAANDDGKESPAQGREKSGSKWISALIAIALLLFILNFLTQMTPPKELLTGGDAAVSASTGSIGGMPQSADEFLMGR